jgi:hypothetical protein
VIFSEYMIVTCDGNNVLQTSCIETKTFNGHQGIYLVLVIRKANVSWFFLLRCEAFPIFVIAQSINHTILLPTTIINLETTSHHLIDM